MHLHISFLKIGIFKVHMASLSNHLINLNEFVHVQLTDERANVPMSKKVG